VNHSYDHPHTPKVPLEHNFLLSPGVNFRAQVLRTEVALLEHRLVPSPFFRFPGLVANAELIDQLRALSLIPVGTDAWLAKGQRPRSGSFILVHGNGNEPAGVSRLLRFMHARPDIALLPLPTAFADR
jgi:peptidoglycan/xylan/chitin deacetylase (PgdA/CDA1 family)